MRGCLLLGCGAAVVVLEVVTLQRAVVVCVLVAGGVEVVMGGGEGVSCS